MKPLLFNLGKNEVLSQAVAVSLGAEPGDWNVRDFPDGECYVRCLSDCQNRTAIILCSLEHPREYGLSLLLAVAIATWRFQCRSVLLCMGFLRINRLSS